MKKTYITCILYILILTFNNVSYAQCTVTTPSICLVTVDSVNFNHNIVVWNKPISTEIDSFKIYREIGSVFTHIASVSYDSLSEYHDFGANPNLGYYRYKISAKDICGNETPLSPYHQTIFLSYLGGGNFSWTDYFIEGQTATYSVINELKRDNTGVSGTWTTINSMPAFVFTMQDFSYTSYPAATYHIKDFLSYSCDPTRTTINTTRSNIKNQSITTAIIPNNTPSFLVYPNPSSGSSLISIEGSKSIKEVSLFNIQGQCVSKSCLSIPTTLCTVNLYNICSGCYFVKVTFENGESVAKKIIISN